MLKKLLMLLGLSVLLVACGGNEESAGSEEDASEKEKTIEVNEELSFLDFKAEIKKVKVYEEDGAYLLDIPIKWLNLTEDSKMLMQVTSMDVNQSGEILDEVNNAWLDNEGEVRIENASRGEWTADLTYELENDSDPVDITFVPHTDEDSQVITIEIQ